MRYRLREKVLSLRDRYTICDPAGVELFEVEGKLMTLLKRLRLLRADGQELARIGQRWAVRPTYHVEREGLPTTVIRRMFLPILRARFVMETPGLETVEIRGNLWSHEYEFHRGSQRIGFVSKKVFSWTDSYGVDVNDEEDQVLFICATVVVDLVSHERQGGS